MNLSDCLVKERFKRELQQKCDRYIYRLFNTAMRIQHQYSENEQIMKKAIAEKDEQIAKLQTSVKPRHKGMQKLPPEPWYCPKCKQVWQLSGNTNYGSYHGKYEYLDFEAIPGNQHKRFCFMCVPRDWREA